MNQPDMSDVRFLVEGQEVPAHRAILAVRSEYFRVLLFNGHMRESVQATVAGGTINPSAPIELRDVSHTVFLKVLEYLYTDTVRDVNLEDRIHLLIASEQFMLDRLKALCEDIIRRDINVDNVINILVTSHQHNALGLKEIALEFILRNLRERSIQLGLSVSCFRPICCMVVVVTDTNSNTLAFPRRT
jgi:speckle-type POZ protein